MFFISGDGMQSKPPTPSVQLSQPCRQFEFPEIQSATDNFNESLVIGHGGFGKVYKGNLVDGSLHVLAAIKRLDSMSSQGASEFWTEVEMLSKLRHCHLVSLFGYCNYGKEMILIYEYMPNGTLDDHLHKLGTPLPWLQRLKICIGAARGLDYLHTGTGTETGVIHRDVKTSNILLQENWEAKISDFGLSKIGPTNQPSTYVNTVVKGTFGYLDPNYYTTGKLTRKCDVYAFGVVLLEVICRRRAVNSSLDEYAWDLATRAQDYIKQGIFEHMIDSDIRGEISPYCLKEFVGIAERCLLSNPKLRPTMAEIVCSLESVLTFQEKTNSEKTNSSMQTPCLTSSTSRPIFRRMLDIFYLPSNEKISGIFKVGSKISSSSKAKILKSSSYLKSFSFIELKKATRSFHSDSFLGEGGYGFVYKGWIDEDTPVASKPGSGMVIAVKILKPERLQDHKKWLAKVQYLGQLHHPNLVKLIGYCSEGDNRLLVYEFMSNRGLESQLFRRGPEPLPWAARFKVAIGAARGLAFLHGAKDQIIYRVFKASHILLDAEFNAKLSDFDSAKARSTGDKAHVSTQVMGTHGYAAPEYVATGRLTAKSDVYGYGVVVLELLSGRRAFDKEKVGIEADLVKWTKPYLRSKRRLSKIMDTRLEGQYPKKGAYTVATIASRCVSLNPKNRPKMSKVLASLEKLQTAKDVSNAV